MHFPSYLFTEKEKHSIFQTLNLKVFWGTK